ncbi:MAG TPA: ABC transporter ATP-binding protein, partial [Bifidobacterium sp.]|nr:ABC transporter ATP-binding protein [Bifidobacterium sp.]
KNEKIVLDLFRQLHEQGTTIIVVTHDALVASCAQREIMLNHGVLVGEQWNDKDAQRAYEAAGGKPARTGAAAEGAQNGGVAIAFSDPTKAAKTGAAE